MFNKKVKVVLAVTLIVLITTLTTISATNSTDTIQTDDQIQNIDNNIHTQDTIQHNDTSSKTTKNNKIQKKDSKTIKNENQNAPISISSTNYNRYFTAQGKLSNLVSQNTSIILSGEFNNKHFIISKPGINLIGEEDVLIKNGQIKITDDATNTTITNLKINIEDLEIEAAIDNRAIGTTILNNDITIKKDVGLTYGIRNIENNVKIVNNTINVKGPSTEFKWSGSSDDTGIINTAAITTQYAENVTITENTLNVEKSENSENYHYGTIEAIDLSGNLINVTNNIVKISGGRFTHPISGKGLKNSNITNNQVTVSGERYVNGIQIVNGAENVVISKNIIHGECHNSTIFIDDDESLAYGIIISSNGGESSKNSIVANNTITLDATICYGMEIYASVNTTIINNNLDIKSLVYASGIVYAHSPNSRITNNNINTTGDSRIVVNKIVEEIEPANNGIRIQQDSNNIKIVNNTIKSIDLGDKVNSISAVSSKDIEIINNTLDTNIKQAADSITYTADNVTIKDTKTSITGKKTANITVVLPKDMVYGTIVNISTKVVDNTTNNPINKGVVVFKINGKTVKINSKNKIKIDDNGMATIKYDLTQLTSKKYNITAVFGNNNDYDRADAKTLNFTVTKTNLTQPNIKPYIIYSGEKIVINQTLKDKNGKQLIGISKIAIKYNGRTVKHANITDGKLNIDVEIPLEIKYSNNTLQIIIGENSRYTTTKLNIKIITLKQKPVFTIEKITANRGAYITLKVTIKTNVTKNNAVNGNVGFKIDGKTQHDMDEFGNIKSNTVKIRNGVATIHLYLPFNIKTGVHNITITFSGTNYLQSGRYTSDALTVKL